MGVGGCGGGLWSVVSPLLTPSRFPRFGPKAPPSPRILYQSLVTGIAQGQIHGAQLAIWMGLPSTSIPKDRLLRRQASH